MNVSSHTFFRNKKTLLLLPMIAVLSACGSSSDSSPPLNNSDTTAPKVSSTTPVNNATEIDRTTEISITFNEDMLAKTVIDDNFTLRAQSAAEGHLDFAPVDNVATFTPSQPLLLATTYTATLSADITDTSGNPLAGAPHSWSFTTADGAWANAEPIESNLSTEFSRAPDIAVDANGNALALWARYSDSSNKHSIWGNQYSANAGWTQPELIQTTPGDAGAPQIQFDANGNAVAIWAQAENVGYGYLIYANRYTPDAGWGSAELIQTKVQDRPEWEDLAVNDNGSALVVWTTKSGGNVYLHSNHYSPEQGWGQDELIGTATRTIESPHVAMDNDGNGLVLWKHLDGSGYKFFANHYSTGSGWATAAALKTDKVGDTYTPDVAFDGSGNALAVWTGYSGRSGDNYASRYTPGSGWSDAELLETATGRVSMPKVAADASGNALAVWAQKDDSDGLYNIYANRYTSGSGWGGATLIENTEGTSHSRPQVVVDPSGNALVLAFHSDGVDANLQATRYLVGTGWGTAEFIGNQDPSDFEDPQIAIGANGNGVAVWSEYDGTSYNINANQFQ